MLMRHVAVLFVTIAFAACSREAPPPAGQTPPPVASAPVEQPAPAPAEPAPPPAPPPVQAAPVGGAVDQSNPVAVLEAVFAAARSGQYAPLAPLCAPNADGDTRMICSVATEQTNVAEFQRFFSTGQVTGPAVVNGAAATVPFSFGPDGRRTEEMNLAQIDGRWFLVSF
jgi:hypothetical protein